MAIGGSFPPCATTVFTKSSILASGNKLQLELHVLLHSYHQRQVATRHTANSVCSPTKAVMSLKLSLWRPPPQPWCWFRWNQNWHDWKSVCIITYTAIGHMLCHSAIIGQIGTNCSQKAQHKNFVSTSVRRVRHCLQPISSLQPLQWIT